MGPVDTPLHRRSQLGPGGLAYSGLPYVWESIPRGKDTEGNRKLLICAEAGTKGCLPGMCRPDLLPRIQQSPPRRKPHK